jgi:hypothetical protein
VRGHILGTRLGHYVGAGLRHLLDEAVARTLAQPAASRQTETCELILAGSGQTRAVHLTVTAMQDAEASVLVAIEDITARGTPRSSARKRSCENGSSR